MTDKINKPAHYHKNGIDVIKFAEAQFSKEEQKGFYRINAIKYITRYDRKNGLEDLEKAKFYIDKLIAMENFKPVEIDQFRKENNILKGFVEDLAAIGMASKIPTYYGGYNLND